MSCVLLEMEKSQRLRAKTEDEEDIADVQN
jgi:hypothetical protein